MHISYNISKKISIENFVDIAQTISTFFVRFQQQSLKTPAIRYNLTDPGLYVAQKNLFGLTNMYKKLYLQYAKNLL